MHLTSLAATGRKLGLTGPALSNWKNGTSHAQPEAVEEMAKAIGLDPDEWVLRVQAERDEQVNPRRAKVWLRCAQRISGTAAGVALALGLAVYTPESHASGREMSILQNPSLYTLCEHLCCLRSAATFRETLALTGPSSFSKRWIGCGQQS
ncbi:helix-turn-helix domain-containing protein [Xanthomonas sp. NCPPB 2632]|uniref:helix-turn-helix domain-containing protein n=1 Tax=Xanthomonas sp. NCPPB 2632 TaxID=3240912 RepID=UPI0035188128